MSMENDLTIRKLQESIKNINHKNGVRIDIWTHLMRGCIINYVH